MDNKNGKTAPEGKTRKKPERHPYKYDVLIKEIRKVCPCNRSALRNMAVEYMISANRNDEGILDAVGVQNIATYVQENRTKTVAKVVIGLDV